MESKIERLEEKCEQMMLLKVGRFDDFAAGDQGFGLETGAGFIPIAKHIILSIFLCLFSRRVFC